MNYNKCLNYILQTSKKIISPQSLIDMKITCKFLSLLSTNQDPVLILNNILFQFLSSYYWKHKIVEKNTHLSFLKCSVEQHKDVALSVLLPLHPHSHLTIFFYSAYPKTTKNLLDCVIHKADFSLEMFSILFFFEGRKQERLE